MAQWTNHLIKLQRKMPPLPGKRHAARFPGSRAGLCLGGPIRPGPWEGKDRRFAALDVNDRMVALLFAATAMIVPGMLGVQFAVRRTKNASGIAGNTSGWPGKDWQTPARIRLFRAGANGESAVNARHCRGSSRRTDVFLARQPASRSGASGDQTGPFRGEYQSAS